MSVRVMWIAGAAVFSLATSVSAQRVSVAAQEGPHYVGEPMVIRITAEGFDQDPQPECLAGSPTAGLSLQLVGVHPNVSSFTQVINGKVSRYQQVVYTFDFHATVKKSGRYRVAPFTVSQSGRQFSTKAFELRFVDIQTDDAMRVALVLPNGPVYPGQEVPVEIQWWYAGDLNEVRGLKIRSPLFDQFAFSDLDPSRGDTTLPISTQKGTVQLKAHVRRKTLDGREFVVFSSQRKMMVEDTGTIKLAAITASIEKVTRWGVGFFGSRQPVATVKMRSVGRPQTLDVKPLPLDQAPPGFAGGVGRGFTIGVEADRTVLHAGDPVVLVFTVQGDGNLQQAGPPKLTAEGGLDPKQFRLPTGDAAGTMTDHGKRFTMTVRVLDESVSQLPPVPYAWFDPYSQRFETTTSQPIALRVLPSDLVTAQDVVSAGQEQQVVNATSALAVTPPVQSQAKITPSSDLTGADLAIQTDVNRLLNHKSGYLSGWLTHTGIYVVSLTAILIGWCRRRTTDVDPELRQRRKAVRADVKVICRAVTLPRQEAAGQIAVALRRLASRAGVESRDQIDRLLAECDAVAYAPVADGSATLDGSICQRASAVARAVKKEVS